MAERYSNLYRLPSGLYLKNCPVIIEAGALLKDNKQDRIVAQLKLRNLSDKTITACKVSIKAFEPNGKEVEGVTSFPYLDIRIKTGEEFGSKTPVLLPDKTTRKYIPSITEIVFDDETLWSSEPIQWNNVPEQQKLSELIPNGDLRDQYGIEVGGNCDFVPEKTDDFFMCACGAINLSSAKKCYNCKREYQVLANALNPDKLKDKSCERLRLEREKAKAEAEACAAAEAERAEKERQKQKEREAKAKKAKIILGITFASVAAVFGACMMIIYVIIPNSKYRNAVELYNSGKYDEAITAFEALNGYKDSEEQITKCEAAIVDSKYNAAIEFYNAGKYDEAITAFQELNGYKDSESRITECETAIKYNSAVELYNAGKYDEAITAFQALNGYKDSESHITECETAFKDTKYNSAVEFYNAKKYEDAYKAFSALDYKDSADKAAECLFLKQKAGLTNVTVGSTIKFGHYEQDDYTANGKEEIEWKVLAVKGKKALVISQYALDCQKYNSTHTDTTWEKCTLRTWLNESFYNSAFDSDHKKMIASSTVTADKNPSYSTSSGNNTTDKVFLLSITEANKYFESDTARKCDPTNYAIAQGANTNSSYPPFGRATCWWWLRSSGSSSNNAAGVRLDGSFSGSGLNVDNSNNAVRPAMWINLE